MLFLNKTFVEASSQSSNSSNVNNTGDFPLPVGSQFIIYQTINAVFILILTWLLIAFAVYGVDKKMWRGQERVSTFFITLATLGPFVSIIELIMFQFLLFTGRYLPVSDRGDEKCVFFNRMGSTLLVIVGAIVYIFLWLRQKTLYSRKLFSSLNNTFIKVISTFSITYIFACSILAIIFFSTFPVKFSYDLGCVYDPEGLLISRSTRTFFIALGKGFIHITLFTLFFYPMFRQSKIMLAIPAEGNEEVTTQHITARRVLHVIKLSAFSLGYCLFSDMFALLVIQYYCEDLATCTGTMYHLSMVISNLAVMFSYEHWQEIALAPIYHFSGGSRFTHTSSQQTSSLESKEGAGGPA